MRRIRSALVVCAGSLGVGSIPFLLVVERLFADKPPFNVQTDAADHNRDTRPSGKYLVEICTLSGENRTLTCSPTPLATGQLAPKVPTTPSPIYAAPQLRDQAITLKLTCAPAAMSDCTPPYPVVAGSDFFVAGTADSGGVVQQTVLSGPVTAARGSGTVLYHTNAPGLIIIRGTLTATGRFAAAAPVDLLIQVIADQSKAPAACEVLPAPTPTRSTLLDARTIVSLLGDPAPFQLFAQGPNTIAIYSTRQPLDENERTILNSFPDSIVALAGHTPTALGMTPMPTTFSVELSIAHASALGDLAQRVNKLNYTQFVVQNVGKDKIRVTAPAATECNTWKAFLTDIRDMEWQLISEPMSKKLFYLSSSDVVNAFKGLASGVPATAAIPVASIVPGASASPAAAAASADSTLAASTDDGTAEAASDPLTAPAASNKPTDSKSTKPTVSNASSATSQTQATSAAGGVTPPPNASANSSVEVAVVAAQQPQPDLLVFSDTNPGDDAQIGERLRIIAQLDLPRPEMILNAWVTQNSSSSKEATGEFINMVKDLVAGYDGEFQRLVLKGWQSLKTQSLAPGYFNEPFRSYVADRFVADTIQEKRPGNNIQERSQAFLDHSGARLVDPVGPGKRTMLGICERGRYCLGYNDLFRPLKPALTDLLLMIVAAQDPVKASDAAILAVEGGVPLAKNEKACDVKDEAVESRCRAIWNTLAIDTISPPPAPWSCADEDFRGILASLLAPSERAPRIHLRCFAQQVHLLLSNKGGAPPSGVGLLRAAVADFLFNYKMSQQYAHEFVAYDLSHSADALNAALNPIIDAFNRDLLSYQLFVRADMQYRVEHLNAGKTSFFNDGLITVRTVSGQWTNVTTTSQSFLDASIAPQLSAVLKSLGAADQNAANAPSSDGAVPVGNPTISTQTLAAALANYQTTVAQIGRDLNISALPRSLAAASSAEIAVTLTAADSAGSPFYTGPGQNDPSVNTSRVARHDTTTRVRVDSVKLFEISSLTGIVERSRSRFPLVPPFVEIPYIGTFVGIPLPAAKEYHSSTAILSAYVIPTAADIAYGLRFVPDLVVDSLNPGPCSFYKGVAGPSIPYACLFRTALSVHDLSNRPVRDFNQQMTRCLALDTSAKGCLSVAFDSVPNTN
jgi:hypothetical protein